MCDALRAVPARGVLVLLCGGGSDGGDGGGGDDGGGDGDGGDGNDDNTINICI